MDKLKYIKLENEDGSYSDSIPLSVSADYVDIPSTSETLNLTNYITNNNIDINNLKSTTSNLQNKVNNNTNAIQGLASGSPLVASSTSGMTNTSRVYVNTTDGNWYYYNGTSWVSGGVYQSTGLDLDTTLTDSSKASNSKSVGDYVSQNRANIQINSDRVKNYDGIITVTDLMMGRISYDQSGFLWIHDNGGKKLCINTRQC